MTRASGGSHGSSLQPLSFEIRAIAPRLPPRTRWPEYSGVRGLTVETRRRATGGVQQSYHCSRGASGCAICTRAPAQSPGLRLPFARQAERSGSGRRATCTHLRQLRPMRKSRCRTRECRPLFLALGLSYLQSGFHGQGSHLNVRVFALPEGSVTNRRQGDWVSGCSGTLRAPPQLAGSGCRRGMVLRERDRLLFAFGS